MRTQESGSTSAETIAAESTVTDSNGTETSQPPSNSIILAESLVDNGNTAEERIIQVADEAMQSIKTEQLQAVASKIDARIPSPTVDRLLKEESRRQDGSANTASATAQAISKMIAERIDEGIAKQVGNVLPQAAMLGDTLPELDEADVERQTAMATEMADKLKTTSRKALQMVELEAFEMTMIRKVMERGIDVLKSDAIQSIRRGKASGSANDKAESVEEANAETAAEPLAKVISEASEKMAEIVNESINTPAELASKQRFHELANTISLQIEAADRRAILQRAEEAAEASLKRLLSIDDEEKFRLDTIRQEIRAESGRLVATRFILVVESELPAVRGCVNAKDHASRFMLLSRADGEGIQKELDARLASVRFASEEAREAERRRIADGLFKRTVLLKAANEAVQACGLAQTIGTVTAERFDAIKEELRDVKATSALRDDSVLQREDDGQRRESLRDVRRPGSFFQRGDSSRAERQEYVSTFDD